MPHLVEMDKKYRKKGLILIGEDVQNSSAEAIASFAEKHKVTFPMTKGTKRPPSLRGIPHMLVFDTEGNCVYAGHPADDACEKAIKEALKAATPPEGGGQSSGDDFFAKKELVPLRTWTNTDGNKLEASLVSITGTAGTFRKANGQTFTYDTDKLTAEDQEVISQVRGDGEE